MALGQLFVSSNASCSPSLSELTKLGRSYRDSHVDLDHFDTSESDKKVLATPKGGVLKA